MVRNKVEDPDGALLREKLYEFSEEVPDVEFRHGERETGAEEAIVSQENDIYEITLVIYNEGYHLNIDHEEEHGTDTYSDIESFEISPGVGEMDHDQLFIDGQEWNLK